MGGTAALVFDRQGLPVAMADRERRQGYPQSGWVEHDPVEIFENTLAVGAVALRTGGIWAGQVAAIGITNQRETTVIWDLATGRRPRALARRDHSVPHRLDPRRKGVVAGGVAVVP